MLVDIMQVVTILINIYISFTENKKHIYVATFAINFAQMVMYFFNNDIATSLVYIIITVRAFIYIYRDKIKNNWFPYVLIGIHIAIGFTSIDKPLQILSTLIPCYTCWYLWFYEDTQKIRIGNIIANSLWTIYNICTGLYIILIMRAITIGSNWIAYIKRKKELEN